MIFIYLFLWLILSSKLSLDVTIAGAVISLVVYLFARNHMRYRADLDRQLFRKALLGLKYAATLVWQTAKANVSVFRIVFSRTIRVEPRLIYFRTDLKTNAAQVTLANSITLTPGTITVALNDGLFCVHCLSGKMAEGIEDSVFVRQLRKFEE